MSKKAVDNKYSCVTNCKLARRGRAYASLLEGTAQFGLVQLATPVSVDGAEPRYMAIGGGEGRRGRVS